jgi:acetyltransferase-like isoleucine patch superfamily enzyme
MSATTTSRLEPGDMAATPNPAAPTSGSSGVAAASTPATNAAPQPQPRPAVKENLFRAFRNRVCQHLARIMPGARSLRISLHRARGVNIGKGVWIGYDVILDTSRPQLITIEDGASLSMRVTVIAHFRETQGVKIEQDAFIGPGVIILPNVTIGRGAVVTAGSVVTQSVAPMTLVQGNPAVPIAKCGVPLSSTEVSVKEFSRRLRPLPKKPNDDKA